MVYYQHQYNIENATCFKEMAAEAFSRYNALSGENSVQHHSYLTAVATNLTFALELGLKSLCMISEVSLDTGIGYGHSLFKLFHSLPSAIQRRLKNSYKYHKENALPQDVSVFTVYLNDYDKNFIDDLLTNYDSGVDMLLLTHQKAFAHWWYNLEGKHPIIFLDYHHLILFFNLLRITVQHEIYKQTKKVKTD